MHGNPGRPPMGDCGPDDKGNGTKNPGSGKH
jgi:hypothetical protein